MKKLMVMVVLGVLLTGCQQNQEKPDTEVSRVVYNGITHGYSVEEAIANGDVVKDAGVTMNILALESFMTLVEEGKEASVNITTFVTDLVPTIDLLEYKEGKFEHTAYQQKMISYDEIEVNEVAGYMEYVLINDEASLIIIRVLSEDI